VHTLETVGGVTWNAESFENMLKGIKRDCFLDFDSCGFAPAI